jgi:dipeptidyl aminopeptidase/acylaminoacyl peptidase
MNKIFLLLLCSPLALLAQKKPLDHSVYDKWQSIGERLVSNDGKWIAYTITPQEGDGDLFVQSADGRSYKEQIARGYNATITEDNRFLVFKIKPLYRETREAKIKKKKLEEMPKDSIGIVELGKDSIIRVAKIKSFKMPEKAAGWLAYQKEKEPASTKSTNGVTQRTVDSLKQKVDSLVQLLTSIKNLKAGNADAADADEDPSAASIANEGSDLVLRNFLTGKETTFKNVADYYFNKNGRKLVLKATKSPKDSLSKNSVVLIDLQKNKVDTILKGGNDFRNFAFTDDGSKLAFLAERDTNTKATQRFYGLYLFKARDDSATLLVDKKSPGMQLGMTVSENGVVSFSKSGNRVLFGTAPIQPAKDTSLVDIDLVKLDIWNYKDDYLQSQQLFNLQNELKRNYLATYDFTTNMMRQIGSKGIPTVLPTNEGDGSYFVAITDTGRRVQSQWLGNTFKDIYAVNVNSGAKTLVKKNLDGMAFPSSTGKYIIWYDNKLKNYFAWDGKNSKNITSKIKLPLYDEEFDMPDDPNPYGIMGWQKDDAAVFIYDRYDVWKVDPSGVEEPVNITHNRAAGNQFRYAKLDPEEKYITATQPLYFKVQNQKTKKNGFGFLMMNNPKINWVEPPGSFNYTLAAKAKYTNQLIAIKENYESSPALYAYDVNVSPRGSSASIEDATPVKLAETNSQQEQYNWGTAELVSWKTFNGKQSQGILYKPEDFNPKKKYPMLVYFYEKLSDGLYNYIAPAPTPSRLNIPFFVSRGYLVFAPDISYTKGHPGKDAYNYVVSGVQSVAKNPWVDAKNIGIQGQSWGGYQVAYLVTATNMFKAAWAGAPVVDMFSAYGGIRWEGGVNRQFQYEKTQSRIGSTPWQHPELYIENSPLFHLKNVTTPLVIMSNDADGAVPWYQGIEFFTAMRRLNKPVWLLSYNGEAHNLVERKNRKDIQVREQQYFDWLLKGDKPAKWIIEGVPAVNKGRDWGLEIVY